MLDGGVRRPLHCFCCKQIGHYASECINLKANDNYAPSRGNCKESGHTYEQYNTPFNFNNRDHHI